MLSLLRIHKCPDIQLLTKHRCQSLVRCYQIHVIVLLNFLWSCFDDEIKTSSFGNSKETAIKTLSDFSGNLGKASSYKMTNQNYNQRKDGIYSYYIVFYYTDMGARIDVALELLIKINNNKFSLSGFKQSPI